MLPSIKFGNFPNILRPRALVLKNNIALHVNFIAQKRMIIAAPRSGQGPLMERRPDRELPDINDGGMRWYLTIPVFIVILTTSCFAIFNYQKSSSSVVASTMYALRTSPKARNILGDEIYFAHKIPWIWGDIDLLHGKIDIHFTVKGTLKQAEMRFTSYRPTRMGVFETTEWSLESADGDKIDLLEGKDPIKIMNAADNSENPVIEKGSHAHNLSR